MTEPDQTGYDWRIKLSARMVAEPHERSEEAKVRVLSPPAESNCSRAKDFIFTEQRLSDAQPLFDSALAIRAELLSALGQVDHFTQCSVLDYPDHFNVGDHLIWLGLVSWLCHVRKARINYVASSHSFSSRSFEKQSPRHPILFTGGGNMGDLWPTHQGFREKIIARYHDRPIIIMPQSLFFKNSCYFKKAQRIFNAHPNLTIFTRDHTSFTIASEHFDRCRVLLAPDIAFQLADWLTALPLPEARFPALLLKQNDQEISRHHPPLQLTSDKLAEADWETAPRLTRWYQKILRKLPSLWAAPSPDAIVSNTLPLWQNAVSEMADDLSRLPTPSLHLRSLDMCLKGVRQIIPFRQVVTNRLHGHILCILLGIPNTLLPDAYYKNQAFYSAWTRAIPSCKFSASQRGSDEESDKLNMSNINNTI